jgi:hypothetical protein
VIILELYFAKSNRQVRFCDRDELSALISAQKKQPIDAKIQVDEFGSEKVDEAARFQNKARSWRNTLS